MDRLRAVLMACCLAVSVTSGAEGSVPSTHSTPHRLSFELGGRGFLRGDSIQIIEVWGDRKELEVGGHYVVRGTYQLDSMEAAALSVYLTNGRVDGFNTERISKGSGRFQLSFRILELGYPHVSFYPLDGRREGIGGVYFGEGERLLRSAKWYERLNGGSPSLVGR